MLGAIQKKRSVFLYLFFFCAGFYFGQDSVFYKSCSKIPGLKILSRSNQHYKEYYEIRVTQPSDHSDKKSKTFEQRIFLGFKDFDSPVVFMTDGYAIDYSASPTYSNEIATEFSANLMTVEHRFSGKSLLDSLNWDLLTVKQAAEDYHAIKLLFKDIFKSCWISGGISKGGQAALAYKMYFPKDVQASVVYGTAVKNKETVLSDSLLFNLSQTPCGKKINSLQSFLFRNKARLIPDLENHILQKGLNFEPTEKEIILDYMLLEFPFSYWQSGSACGSVPDTSASAAELFKYLAGVVPPRFFSNSSKERIASSFYMFYHELGYYEYSAEPWKKYLKGKDYSNRFFTPSNVNIKFNPGYQKDLGVFLKDKAAESIFFIYGKNDPWYLQTQARKNVHVLEGSGHKTRINDFKEEDKKKIYTKIREYCKN